MEVAFDRIGGFDIDHMDAERGMEHLIISEYINRKIFTYAISSLYNWCMTINE